MSTKEPNVINQFFFKEDVKEKLRLNQSTSEILVKEVNSKELCYFLISGYDLTDHTPGFLVVTNFRLLWVCGNENETPLVMEFPLSKIINAKHLIYNKYSIECGPSKVGLKLSEGAIADFLLHLIDWNNFLLKSGEKSSIKGKTEINDFFNLVEVQELLRIDPVCSEMLLNLVSKTEEGNLIFYAEEPKGAEGLILLTDKKLRWVFKRKRSSFPEYIDFNFDKGIEVVIIKRGKKFSKLAIKDIFSSLTLDKVENKNVTYLTEYLSFKSNNSVNSKSKISSEIKDFTKDNAPENIPQVENLKVDENDHEHEEQDHRKIIEKIFAPECGWPLNQSDFPIRTFYENGLQRWRINLNGFELIAFEDQLDLETDENSRISILVSYMVIENWEVPDLKGLIKKNFFRPNTVFYSINDWDKPTIINSFHAYSQIPIEVARTQLISNFISLIQKAGEIHNTFNISIANVHGENLPETKFFSGFDSVVSTTKKVNEIVSFLGNITDLVKNFSGND